MNKDKFETIEEFQVIWAEHVGRTEAWWVQHKDLIVDFKKRQDLMSKRISTLETKVALWGALGGTLAGLIMQILPKILPGG